MANSVLAYFDSAHEMPEEIIMAAGFAPYKIIGDVHVSNEPADQYLAQFFCPAARSFLTEALKSSGNWSGIIFAHGCDATNRHYDVWKMHVKTPFLYWVNTPMKVDASAAKFYKKELNSFVKALEKQFNVQISVEKLQAAIKNSNEIKVLLQQLGTLRATKDIPNREYFEVMKMVLTQPKDQALISLKKRLSEWNAKSPFPANKKKIFLTGSDVTYAEWFDTLDEAGLRVVRDDLSIGERYYATLIPGINDPLEALVEYNFNIPRPASRNPPDPRTDYILKVVAENQLAGIVSQNIKFCELYAYDSVHTMNAFKAKNVPAIHVEREFTPSVDQQLLNRLEAFRETLN